LQEVIPVAKNKPYASDSVKSVDVESLCASHAGQACVVGVDVAKFELMAVLRWPGGSFQRPWRIINPEELGLLMALLEDAERGTSHVIDAEQIRGTSHLIYSHSAPPAKGSQVIRRDAEQL
jgi:hypothetical protein